jgi:hypothetical protein
MMDLWIWQVIFFAFFLQIEDELKNTALFYRAVFSYKSNR